MVNGQWDFRVNVEWVKVDWSLVKINVECVPAAGNGQLAMVSLTFSVAG
jgi:hypothetical protein